MQRVIFGTYQLQGEKLANALQQAYTIGNIRRFDTAQLYCNERETCKHLEPVEQKHDDVPIQVTTKIRKIANEDGTLRAIRKSEQRIGEAKLNTILLHRPMPMVSWHTLEKHCSEKYQIGVSNYTVKTLDILKQHAKQMPAINQIEFHPHCPGALETLRWCQENGIKVQGHTILAKAQCFETDVIRNIAASINKSPAQVMIRWAYQHGVDLVLSTTDVNHLHEWREVVEDKFELSEAQMAALNHLSASMPIRFYECNWTPWMWAELSSDPTFLKTAVEQLKLDRSKLANKERVSELALSLPSIRGNDVSETAKFLAEQLFPLDPKKNTVKSPNGAVYSCRGKYRDLMRSLRRAVHEQRQAAAESKRHVARMCCLRPPSLQPSDEVANPKPMPVNVASADVVRPFFTWLSNAEDKPEAALTFVRGTMFPDGRMDFCKQVTGNEHIRSLCESVRKNKFVRHFLLGNNVACQGDNTDSAQAMAELMADQDVDIETWYLAGNEIGPRCTQVICKALEADEHCRALWLKRNPIGTEDGPMALGRLLGKRTPLELLDLHNCGLLDQGLSNFVAACGMFHPIRLKHIYLDANGLTERAGPILKQWCELNRDVLESIYISINRLGDEGIIQMAEGLRKSKSLKRLCVASNQLTDVGFQTLIEIALTWPALICFDAGYYKSTLHMGERPNLLGQSDEDGTVDALCKLMTQSSRLEYVSVLNNQLSAEAVTKLAVCARQVNEEAGRTLSVNLVQYDHHPRKDDGGCSATIQAHDKLELRSVKHDPRIVHIDSVYRNSMK